ncbi:hypothetical protein DPEC_G00172980 [Dallia pectoralis]|uniref:Uncharacterized protein n=1 Tax=Dallia pectoralis TaxID=75939 RepID=A0ACC2GEC1_DALPE|nr:hypothetical protein DPEC_G00172980 [Dallia pectoralis]
MEVAVAEEKKKIFRARKTMKISDRQQLESLHSTLSSPAPSLSNSSNSNSPSTPSPLTNGTHTEDRQKVADGETNDITDSKNSRSTTPVSPACLTSRSPPLALSLSLSASPPSPENPKAKEDTNPSPSSPFHNINDMLKQMEEEGKEDDSPTALSNKEMEREHTEAAKTNKKEEKDPGTEIEDACTTTGKRPEDQAPMDQSPVDSPFSSVTDDKEPGKDKETEKEEDSVAMETDTNKDHTDTKASEVSISTATEEKPSTPKASTMASSPSSPTPSPSAVPEMDANIKDKEVQNTGEKKKVDSQEEEDVVRKEEKMEVVSVKDLINEKRNVAESSASSSLSTCKVEKGLKIKEEHTSSPGQKRHLSDDDERNGVKVERDGKRQRVQGVELEAQLELKITANSGSRQKLEKFVHKMVAERLRVLQLTVFDQGLQELKDRVEKIDCATKHQSTLNTLQAKIARLAKKFGEANQASENKRKHEMLQNLDEMESDGGSEIESDGGSEIVPEIDVSDDGCSSESDIEPPPPMPEPRRRKTRKEPTETTTAANSTPAELYSTTVMTSGEATLTVYRCKKNENMCLLSTMHPCVSITNGLKKKPETVTDYNHSKVGVDTLAQMARLYSVMGGTRRWPVAVFYNLLDLAAINAHVLYEKCLGKTISRRDFIMDLAFELRGNHMIAKRATKEAAKEARFARPRYLPLPQPLPPGKKIQCQVLTNAKTVPSSTTTPTQRPVAAVVKQPMTTTVSTNLPVQQPNKPNPTTTAMVTPGSILQLIPTSSNSASLGTVTSQSGPTGTLLLKTTSGSNLVGQNGQPLLIQLPLSAMAHGGSGTLVNIPVSSFSTGNSLNKSKTTTPTTTYIIKASPTTSTMAGSATTMALQAISSTTQSSPAMSPAQMTLARAVYQGGAGGISTPSAGVSVTTARAPIQLASVPGVVSSSSSPVTSGPAATGSAAPGPPSGTVMTSKTDNQASSSTSTKTAIPGTRPKGSFIDLTEEEEEDDDDVLVTGVKKATTTTVAGSSVTQRSTGPPPLISTPSGNTTRASPQQSVSSPQLATIHYRPPLDSPSKARIGNNTTPTKASSVVLPPLPSAPLPAGRLPMEATQTSPPQQPQLKLARVQTQNGIVLSWCVAETDRTCAVVESYHLYAYHQESAGSAGNGPGAGQHWKKIGEVKALPLPMACTLTQFVSGSTYYFAVRARDVYGRFGPFCEPQCTDVISSTSS